MGRNNPFSSTTNALHSSAIPAPLQLETERAGRLNFFENISYDVLDYSVFLGTCEGRSQVVHLRRGLHTRIAGTSYVQAVNLWNKAGLWN